MQQLRLHHGEAWRSFPIPLSIDGLMAAASMVLLTRRRSGLPTSPSAIPNLCPNCSVYRLKDAICAAPYTAWIPTMPPSQDGVLPNTSLNAFFHVRNVTGVKGYHDVTQLRLYVV